MAASVSKETAPYFIVNLCAIFIIDFSIGICGGTCVAGTVSGAAVTVLNETNEALRAEMLGVGKVPQVFHCSFAQIWKNVPRTIPENIFSIHGLLKIVNYSYKFRILINYFNFGYTYYYLNIQIYFYIITFLFYLSDNILASIRIIRLYTILFEIFIL